MQTVDSLVAVSWRSSVGVDAFLEKQAGQTYVHSADGVPFAAGASYLGRLHLDSFGDPSVSRRERVRDLGQFARIGSGAIRVPRVPPPTVSYDEYT